MSKSTLNKADVQVGDLVWLTYGPVKPGKVVTVDEQGIVLDKSGRWPFERVSVIVRNGIAYNTKPMHVFDPTGL